MSKLYLRSTTGNTAGYVTATKAINVHFNTEVDVSGITRRDLKTTPGAAVQNLGITYAATATSKDGYYGKWISDPIAVNQVDANSWAIALSGAESNGALNAFMIAAIYVLKSDDTVRGFIYDDHTSLSTEFGTSQEGHIAIISGAQVTGCVSTDRIAFELWVHTANTMTTSYNFFYWYDGPDDITDGGVQGGAFINTPQDLFTIPAIIKSGTGISPNEGSGADVVTFSETGVGISPNVALGPKTISVSRTGAGISPRTVSGSKIREFAGKTGLGISSFVASGPKLVERTFAKTGLGISDNFIASGVDVFTATETGTGVSSRTASSADVFTASETGSGISAFIVLGANANIFSESGTGTSPFTTLGARARDLPRTGAVISPRIGSGADAIIFAETGAGIMVMTASGTKVLQGQPIIYTKTGLAIAALIASGVDISTRSETGSVVIPFVASGTSFRTATAVKTGLSVVPFVSSGADMFIVTETGSGIITMTGAGFLSELFEIPCLYLPLTAEIEPHITSVEQNLISYMITVGEPKYIVTVTDSYVLVATVDEEVTTATIDDINTLTEIEMKSC